MKQNRHGYGWKDPLTHPQRKWPKHGRAHARREAQRQQIKA